uniref:Reverse transcriptase/retrotransposon-derived protein RNase H-like domain-containing protein n=1 Tax=Amphimedon queenslandica TaxID=400682 RepID=A0A1X7VX40_AMPQE
MYRLIKKDVPFVYDQCFEKAFVRLKQSLMESHVLQFPHMDKTFVLETDTTNDGLGAVLAPEGADMKLHPIPYTSRTTQGAETNYASSELEALAVF